MILEIIWERSIDCSSAFWPWNSRRLCFLRRFEYFQCTWIFLLKRTRSDIVSNVIVSEAMQGLNLNRNHLFCLRLMRIKLDRQYTGTYIIHSAGHTRLPFRRTYSRNKVNASKSKEPLAFIFQLWNSMQPQSICLQSVSSDPWMLSSDQHWYV